MIPDGSIVWALTLREQGEAPAGLDVMSNNPFMAEDENTSVIAYRDEEGTSLRVDTLPKTIAIAREAQQQLGKFAHVLIERSPLLSFGYEPVDELRDDVTPVYSLRRSEGW